MIPVVADAVMLFGATKRGLLINLDYRGPIRLHWSALMLDELSRALVDTGRKADEQAARRHTASRPDEFLWATADAMGRNPQAHRFWCMGSANSLGWLMGYKTAT